MSSSNAGQRQSRAKTPRKGGPWLTVLSVIVCVLLAPLVIVNTIMAIQGYLRPNELPFALGYSHLVVESNSMEPEFTVDDLIFIHRCDTATLRAHTDEKDGDYITFYDPSVKVGEQRKVITHELMSIQTDAQGQTVFITKGINNNSADRLPVSPQDVVGIYTGKITNAGNVVRFLQSPLGMIVCIGLPIVAFLCYEMMLHRRQVKALMRAVNAQEEKTAAAPAPVSAGPDMAAPLSSPPETPLRESPLPDIPAGPSAPAVPEAATAQPDAQQASAAPLPSLQDLGLSGPPPLPAEPAEDD